MYMLYTSRISGYYTTIFKIKKKYFDKLQNMLILLKYGHIKKNHYSLYNQ